MPIISILNPKGGSGKTTLTTNLAASLAERSFSVLIVDSDPQGSARDWHAANQYNPIPLVSLDRPNNIKALFDISKNYDFVLIDGAAKLEDMIAAAIKVADFILIPVQPSPYDIWAASDLVDFIKARQEVANGKPGAAFVVTRVIDGTKLGNDIRNALNDYDLDTLLTPVTQRQIYPQTSSEGITVMDSSNQKAKNEIIEITNEILQLLSSNQILKTVAKFYTEDKEVKDGTNG